MSKGFRLSHKRRYTTNLDFIVSESHPSYRLLELRSARGFSSRYLHFVCVDIVSLYVDLVITRDMASISDFR